MKQKKYEKISVIIFLSVILFIIELLSIYNLQNRRIIIYKKYPMLIDNTKGIILVSKKEKNIWYKNTYVYWNNRKIKYSIDKIEKVKKDYQITVTPTFKEKMKENIIEISIEEQRISMIKAIINCWGGDKDN